jgi:hypothetical protein
VKEWEWRDWEKKYDQIRCVNTDVSSLVGKEVKSEGKKAHFKTHLYTSLEVALPTSLLSLINRNSLV